MDAEASKPVSGERPRGLPGVANVQIKHVRFNPPMRFYRKGQLIEEREAIELLVKTTGPMPNLDLTPVLFIGDAIVDEYERVAPNLYRFIAYGLGRLRGGARIALGWPFAPHAKIPSQFSFQLPGPLPVS